MPLRQSTLPTDSSLQKEKEKKNKGRKKRKKEGNISLQRAAVFYKEENVAR